MGDIARSSGFLERDGERIYYEVNGDGPPGEDPPLVLSHGAGGNHAIWYQQVAHFARQRKVVSWDHRGFGRSSDAGARSGPDVAVDDLRALLDHLALDRVDLVGQSMGGWTSLGFALASPERVRRLVLADTLGGISTSVIRELLARALGDAPGAPPADALGRHPALDDGFAERDPERAHLYQMLGAFGEPDLARILPLLMKTRRSSDDLRGLNLPVLFVVGATDRLFPPKIVRKAAAMLTGARVVEIPGCGHSPYFEDAPAWNAAVGEFLAEG